MNKTRVGVSLSDLHCPYHDERAIDLAKRVISFVRPNYLIFNGDVIDFYPLSGFYKNPDTLKKNGLQHELDAWFTQATEIIKVFYESAPEGESTGLYYLPGNHEERLRLFLWKYPALFGLDALTIQKLLRLEELSLEYIEEELVLAGGGLVVRHGNYVGKESGLSAKAELEVDRYGNSTLTGHSHRLGEIYYKTPNGLVRGYEQGCLCRLDPEYIKKPNWHQGLAVITTGKTPVFGQDYHEVELVSFREGDGGFGYYTVVRGELLTS